MKIIKLNNDIEVNLEKLVESKLLVQANSGGGKSWAIRRIVEQAFGQVQIIILDTEGEFTNLREKHDFILVGKNADAPADPRSAELLARRLLELKASAIIDLFELHPQERKRFVKIFLTALVNAPKDLWPIYNGDCLVILDEAHVFAPEKGESEAAEAVIAIASLGRKRGLGLILATQRISKLHKDAAAECNNKLIGRASLDIDRKRAAEEIGFTSREEITSLKNMEPGEFYAFGPAISRDVTKMRVGEVRTKPPGRGGFKTAAPAPTAKVKKILARLADLPKEAAEEAKTVGELRAEVARLKREAVKLPTVVPKATQVDSKTVEMAVKKALLSRDKEWGQVVDSYKKPLAKIVSAVESSVRSLNGCLDVQVRNNPGIPSVPVLSAPPKEDIKHPELGNRSVKEYDRDLAEKMTAYTDFKPSSSQQKILNTLGWLEQIHIKEGDKAQVAFLSDQSPRSSGYTNNISTLRTNGLISYPSPGRVALTEAGRSYYDTSGSPLNTEELHVQIRNKLSSSQWSILKAVIDHYPEPISKQQVAELADQSFTSSGFTNNVSTLRTLGLIDYPSPGMVVGLPILFIQ